ncbi:DUF1254 domain-containing protein [Synechococcus sp. CCY 9618]|uniref:DUF1254 domain-containing protein n=1 Tax=Synechococcus sp. CCY 9618 TaxID=2815602 RepID=UPI001C24B4B2|nr:DUF1254 domain-containing protein [Synechococcus sp. CCY 9618]
MHIGNASLWTLALVAASSLTGLPARSQEKRPTTSVRPIAEEAFIYGFPMVMNYAIFNEYFIDSSGPQFKAPINQIYNTARVYTPKDTTVVTPNSDTPYSFVAIDLRAEPFVLCNPKIESSRYFSVQLIDMYTFNYGYIGSRTTGNNPGCYMIAGPRWRGEKPAGIGKVFRSETDFSTALFRTQLFNPADIDNVIKIQSGYRALPLSTFQNKPAPPAAPQIAWPKINKQLADADPFTYLNFVLAFSPPIGPAAVERPMRARFASIGVASGKPFSLERLTPQQQAEVKTGMKDGLETIRQSVGSLGNDVNGWRIATKGIGDRKAYGGDDLLRATVAMAGIYANDAVEAMYPILSTDSEGNKPDTSTNRYTLTFPAGQLPPVNAFWSVTMYDGKTQLLIENPINRYLINSPMLPDLKKNADGSLTIHIQKDSPGKDRESNWLPAPDGPIYMVMRLYWPKESALSGTWKPPALQRVK